MAKEMLRYKKRSHLDKDKLSWRRDASVFINCPFDNEFSVLFDSMVFSTICCGFIPRCSFETGSTSVPRMVRIFNAILASKYSIHDLSRYRGMGSKNLARFNMSLELGIAMAQNFGSGKTKNHHDWLLLVPKGHTYKEYISDLSGYDPYMHEETPETVMSSVMSWLQIKKEAIYSYTTTPQKVLIALPIFQKAREKLSNNYNGNAPWKLVLKTAFEVAEKKRLIPKPSDSYFI
jgi:hypothetical protein